MKLAFGSSASSPLLKQRQHDLLESGDFKQSTERMLRFLRGTSTCLFLYTVKWLNIGMSGNCGFCSFQLITAQCSHGESKRRTKLLLLFLQRGTKTWHDPNTILLTPLCSVVCAINIISHSKIVEKNNV